ncbi:hypothetical protein [Clostridium tagluense]|uniref:hypothetical protein n=1 Tax=Clostridium tagluense TaxID=360422 RepID=UPI001CF4A384|nr:hypothetical protein [Clostridium tagluense]MCB2312909.1 hypothetical protein [Clostridium tagluense]MCB2317675.1 hypothetical protein [Clostridium tagluense]MCB2327493.1 hypothetical protein [Clostridium tagluense]MCB2332212.1 hypothetical protein [Clostridium tagluense]WAG51711.1 hypothetical protein LL095_05530 [Clostridium tagluense]
MQYYQVKLTLNLKKDLYFDEVTEKLSILFNKSMLYNEYLKSIHKVNVYKLYVFEGLSPFEKDKTYKKGSLYMTRLRCIDEFMAEAFRVSLKNTTTNEFDVLGIEVESIKLNTINKIFNVTPAIAIIDGEVWTNKMDIEVIKNSINSNLLKKLKMINGIDCVLEHDMIKTIEVKNNKPIAFKYKNNKLLGNKFEIKIKEDELSQIMAYVAMATGLLEKNSLGYGYCLCKNR